MFKKIIIDGEEIDYSISEEGQIRRDSTGAFMKGTMMAGYKYFTLRWDGKQKAKGLHRLLAEAFIPNPDNLPVVDHIDGNPLNNNLKNLQWVSYSVNRQKARPPKHTQPRHNEDLPGEEWRCFRDSQYYVSNFGRLKNINTGRVSNSQPQIDGYVRADIQLPGQSRRKWLVHQMVYECFISPDYEIINHINGNKSDNRPENLESCSQKENMIKASKNRAWKIQRRVIQYTLDGKYVQTFESVQDVAHYMGILPSSVRNMINVRSGKSGDYYYRYEEKEDTSTTIS